MLEAPRLRRQPPKRAMSGAGLFSHAAAALSPARFRMFGVLALRLATCPRCKGLFFVCRACDFGRVYCCEECSSCARTISLRGIRLRYRRSDRGREKHKRAERRRRRRQKLLVREASVGDPTSSRHPSCGTGSVRPSSDEPETNGCMEDTQDETSEVPGIKPVDTNPRLHRCAVCGREGTQVNLAATRGAWPRRGYRKAS